MPKAQIHQQNHTIRKKKQIQRKPKYTFPPHFVSGSTRTWVIALLVQKSFQQIHQPFKKFAIVYVSE